MPKEYSNAPEVEAIADKLVSMLKPELEGFEIKFVFNSENPKKDGEEKAGLARVVRGLNAFLAGHPEGFFSLETGRPAWDAMDGEQRVRYVHHELCHFGIADSGNLMLVPHDIEEFNEIAEIHGSADDRLILFGAALLKGDRDHTTRKELIQEILNR